MAKDHDPVVLQGRYVLGKEIGKGSFATVYQGYDRKKKKKNGSSGDSLSSATVHAHKSRPGSKVTPSLPSSTATSSSTSSSDSSDSSDLDSNSSSESPSSSSSDYFSSNDTYQGNVAVKSVSKNALKNKKLLDNLEIEIAILKKINNPHIVKLIDCEITSTNFYLIMEYCSLGDLSFLIKKKELLKKQHPLINKIFEKYPTNDYGGLNKVLVYNYIQQLSSALKFLRSKNLVHRDIKPQNLLLSAPLSNYSTSYEFHEVLHYKGISHLPILKIADFGFARFLPSTSMAETLCGSPLYMAPEILSYQKYNAKADLWSVGGVLYEMCCGKPPFRANNHMELLKKIKQAHDVIIFPSSKKSVGDSFDMSTNNYSSTTTRNMRDDRNRSLRNDRIGYNNAYNNYNNNNNNNSESVFSSSDTDSEDSIDLSDDGNRNDGYDKSFDHLKTKSKNKKITKKYNNDNMPVEETDDILNDEMKELICALLTYDPVFRISFEEFFDNPIITRDLSIYELDNEKDKDEESILEKESHKLLESNLFISEYLNNKKISNMDETNFNYKDKSDLNKTEKGRDNKTLKNSSRNSNNITRLISNNQIPSPIQEESETSKSLKNKNHDDISNYDIENEYVVIEKKTVEFNEFADEVASYKNKNNNINNTPYNQSNTYTVSPKPVSKAGGIMNNLRRSSSSSSASSSGTNHTNISTINPLLVKQVKRSSNDSSSSRRSSFDRRRLSIPSLNPSNALSKAIGIASSRLFNTQASGTNTSLPQSQTESSPNPYNRSLSFGAASNASPKPSENQQYLHSVDETSPQHVNQSLLNEHVFTKLTERLVLTAQHSIIDSGSTDVKLTEATNSNGDLSATKKALPNMTTLFDFENLNTLEIINVLENIGAKAFTIYSFSEIKYSQLFPESNIVENKSNLKNTNNLSNSVVIYGNEVRKASKSPLETKHNTNSTKPHDMPYFKKLSYEQSMHDDSCAIEDSDDDNADLIQTSLGAVNSNETGDAIQLSHSPSLDPSNNMPNTFFTKKQSLSSLNSSVSGNHSSSATNTYLEDRKDFILEQSNLGVSQTYELSMESLLLYMKSLSLLARGMNITSKWWSSHQHDIFSADDRDDTYCDDEQDEKHQECEDENKKNILKLNVLVQYLRAKFNDCLEKAEQLKNFTERLKSKYPELEHGLNKNIVVEKLLYDRALELSKISANLEMKNCFYYSHNCELLYATSLWMLESLLDDSSDKNIECDFDVTEYNLGGIKSASRLEENDTEMIKTYVNSIARRLKSLKIHTSNN